ncbi:MAG TPA: winged helix DNA-binding domain-containing protein [Actinomycetes bacterium]|nr:winged helix DNA-binding domain-containing protein [Actinomycetes bacterium]
MTGPSSPSGQVLSLRALNRALLGRQGLLGRERRSVGGMVEWLVAMQAQNPRDPYVALWTRLEEFDPHELGRMVAEREAVRVPLLRTTLHLVTARDCLVMAPLLRPVLERGYWTGTPFGRKVKGIDIDAVLAAGRELLDERPRTTAQLRALLGERWPGYDASSLAYAVHHLLPVVQVPPRGVWGGKGLPTWATVEQWLGRPLDPAPSIDRLVLRYLAAFGPATVMDVQAWSGLTRLREVAERLGPRLRTFRDPDGKELLDLPDAPLPDPDTPAPPRFLPEYDNVVLGHADRTRIVPGDAIWKWEFPDTAFRSPLLIDGFVQAAWHLKRDREAATLVVEPLTPLPDPPAVEQEATRLLEFLAPEAGRRTIEIVTR